jgi:hypothetical protein
MESNERQSRRYFRCFRVLGVLSAVILPSLNFASSARSVPVAGIVPTFHVQGTITSAWNSLFKGSAVPRGKVSFQGEQPIKVLGHDEKDSYIAVPRSWVKFRSDHISKTVVVDDKGFYSVDLPIGLYKMTMEGPTIGIQKLTVFVRTLRVTSPTSIVLNGSLYLAQMNCDDIGGPEQRKNDCGSEDSFPVPATDGTPFELYIRYPQRRATDSGFAYSTQNVSQPEVPVSATYNLFSLRAGALLYDTKSHKIIATGDVVAEDGSGSTCHAESMTFKLEDGKAISLN